MAILAIAQSRDTLLLAGAVYGVGFGMAQPALMALVADRTTEAERWRAITTYYTGWELGIGVGGYALAHVLARTDFTVLYETAGLIVASGALLYVLGAGRRARGPRPPAP